MLRLQRRERERRRRYKFQAFLGALLVYASLLVMIFLSFQERLEHVSVALFPQKGVPSPVLFVSKSYVIGQGAPNEGSSNGRVVQKKKKPVSQKKTGQQKKKVKPAPKKKSAPKKKPVAKKKVEKKPKPKPQPKKIPPKKIEKKTEPQKKKVKPVQEKKVEPKKPVIKEPVKKEIKKEPVKKKSEKKEVKKVEEQPKTVKPEEKKEPEKPVVKPEPAQTAEDPKESKQDEVVQEPEQVVMGIPYDKQMKAHVALSMAVARAWRPPRGLTDNLSATLQVMLQPDGTISDVIIEKKSGVLAYDMSVKAALWRVEYPREFWGKTVSLLFGPQKTKKG